MDVYLQHAGELAILAVHLHGNINIAGRTTRGFSHTFLLRPSAGDQLAAESALRAVTRPSISNSIFPYRAAQNQWDVFVLAEHLHIFAGPVAFIPSAKPVQMLSPVEPIPLTPSAAAAPPPPPVTPTVDVCAMIAAKGVRVPRTLLLFLSLHRVDCLS